MLQNLEYSRDEGLRAMVLQALAADARFGTLKLRVGVLKAIVHLGGSAPSQKDRSQAEQIAAGIQGVRGVVNRIEAPGAPSPSRSIHLDFKKKED
jgi:osmotically-inducible protein OsmY